VGAPLTVAPAPGTIPPVRAGGIFYGWVVLGAAFAIITMAIGTLFSLGVFLLPIEEATGWSRGAIGSVALLNWVVMGLGSFLWGALSDRVGTRAVVLAGGALLGLGLVLSSQVTALWQFFLTFGLLVGGGVSAFYVPLTSTATRWFTARRGLAVAIVSAGNGLGILLLSPLSRWLISAFDWRTAFIVLGDLAWLVVIPAALLVRNSPAEMGAVALGTPRAEEVGNDHTAASALRSGPFWVIALAHFACCAAHSGPIFHMVAHAMDQGVAKMAAAAILGASGLSSIGGRLAAGLLADRLGAKRMLLTALTLQAGMIALFLVVRDTGAFYALGLAFGVAYGGAMPLYALVTREYFGERVMGTAYGGVFFISSVGMGLGSFAGGFVHDLLGTYQWLFIGSALVGGMAVVLAFTLRPPRPLPAPVAAPVLH
jgi:MFS family permease